MKENTKWLVVVAIIFYAIIGFAIYDHFQKEKELNEFCKTWEGFDKSSPRISEGERYWHEEYGLYCAERLKKMKGQK